MTAFIGLPNTQNIGKANDLGKDLRKKPADLHKMTRSLGDISNDLQILVTSNNCTSASFSEVSRLKNIKWSDERKLVRILRSNLGSTKAQAFHELETGEHWRYCPH